MGRGDLDRRRVPAVDGVRGADRRRLAQPRRVEALRPARRDRGRRHQVPRVEAAARARRGARERRRSADGAGARVGGRGTRARSRSAAGVERRARVVPVAALARAVDRRQPRRRPGRLRALPPRRDEVPVVPREPRRPRRGGSQQRARPADRARAQVHRPLPALPDPAMIHAFALLAFAATLSPTPTPTFAPSQPRPSNPAALERALATISADEIRSDLFFIASDELAGRDTPSPGQRIAARFLRARLQRLGFEPGDEGKDFLYEYTVPRKRIDEAGTTLAAKHGETQLSFAYGKDWSFYTSQDLEDRAIDAPIVWAGSGLDADLEAAKPSGKWIACRDGKGSTGKRRRAAQEAGALGVLVLQERKGTIAPVDERFADILRSLREGSISGPAREPAKDGAPRASVPCAFLAASSATALLSAQAGKPVDADYEPALGAELGSLALSSKLADKNGGLELENVVGFWPGSDPELAKEVVILSAHYDHVGTRRDVVYNGADDNGSGTSTLLAVAEALSQYGPLRRSVLIIWVSGEEKGLWGSRAFASAPWFPSGARAVADINIDMVGRNAPDKLLVTPTDKHEKFNGLTRIAERLAVEEGFPKLGSADSFYSRSDHIEFARLGIPIVFLFSDVHDDYHQPGDDPEKIDCDKVARVARLVTRMLDELQGDKLEL
ncbi:MAG: M28 family peptidase [Planctomycetota bacterium]|nr:MAG: M28 family peptidase [Planctomycetota bacterium]